MNKTITRRIVLAGATSLGGLIGFAQAKVINGSLPWEPGALNAPVHGILPSTQKFLTAAESKLLSAIADRLIPEDELSVSGSKAGCVEFIDRQLAGPYGRAAAMYMRGRFIQGTPEQGIQTATTPAERYRTGLRELSVYVQSKYGKLFEELPVETQDQILSALENQMVNLPSMKGKTFFEQVLQNVREGYLADPIYGGNRDMVSWKMIGFPGARYDYRDYMDIKNRDLKLEPVSLVDRMI